jgi:hypothetical protein
MFFMICFADITTVAAQCSVCTRTAQQMGEKSASGLNAGIMYLAFTPLALFALIGYWWWKKNKTADN